MKITEYPSITEFTDDQVFLLDGDNGTKQANVITALLGIMHLTAVELHRTIFRGKNLGTAITTEQIAAIQAGTFDDLWLGDYWVINDYNWRIVDFNYWYGQGDTACTSHHIVIMPDSYLYTAQMNTSNTTEGGYVGSVMYTSNLANAKTIVNSAFGSSYVLSHREYLTNAVTSGYPSAGAWCNSTVELPNEIMMYGCPVFLPAGTGSVVANRYTVCKTQLALMRAVPYFINPIRQTQWLRDVVSSATFAFVYANGVPDYANASSSNGVRPVFAVG